MQVLGTFTESRNQVLGIDHVTQAPAHANFDRDRDSCPVFTVNMIQSVNLKTVNKPLRNLSDRILGWILAKFKVFLFLDNRIFQLFKVFYHRDRLKDYVRVYAWFSGLQTTHVDSVLYGQDGTL